MARRPSFWASLTAATLIAFIMSAPPGQAAVNIGVAPSPNGLVMVGVPTQIAVSGTKAAVISIWNPELRKYVRIGTAKSGSALPYTFEAGGLQRLLVRPAKGKPRKATVPVYGRLSGFGDVTPTTYGNLILTSAQTIGFRVAGSADDGITRVVTATSAKKCVLADVGAKTDGDAIQVTVQSTGADPVTAVATLDAPVALSNVPVRGDLVVEFKYEGRAHAMWSKPAPGVIGVILTCLGDT